MAHQTRARASLKKFLASDEDVQPVDKRSSELEEQILIDPAVLEALREVFLGTNVIEDESKIRRILDVRAEILRSWSEARDSFISIGRALISLEETLSKTEFQRLRSGSERVFPFSEATATQFRQIARAVDNGRLPYEACPGSYGTAYQITLLDDEQLAIARDRGLLRADVTRREITLLRQETRDKSLLPGRVNKSLLQEERKRLKRREQQISEELETILRRLKELSRLLDREDDDTE
ncbi:hypothetical protein HN018_22125 (plasmid) [Lichenicola cladoniae]|uniref:Uncharacterized protein n=1 Tax=Lichenicola cladoniae TaxID=1484109 RepID=A0A6M8HXJ6_9PROT|nr:hypothetical protein [Lichenicola cladoniae]NPD69845.1 hypothetical protein [Acetobacteraceae bacterium]QKE92925.1 hypothetical protein HN018_22125 [Lichenicola cladoniae]